MRASRLDEWREAEVERFCRALGEHVRRSTLKVTTARCRSPQQPRAVADDPLLRPPTMHDMRIASRRAAAAEAAARRERFAAQTDALRYTLVRDSLYAWRTEAEHGLRALALRQTAARRHALSWWRTWHATRLRDTTLRWLRRWRCIFRAARGRAARAVSVSLVTYTRSLGRTLDRLREHARLSRPVTQSVRAARAQQQLLADVGLWRRVAAARAVASRRCALRRAMHALLASALLAQKASFGQVVLALTRWKRLTAVGLRRCQLASSLRGLQIRSHARRKRLARDQTLRLAAEWTAARSAAQHAMARILAIGWRRERQRERTRTAVIAATVASLVGALHRWRVYGITAVECQTTRQLLVAAAPAGRVLGARSPAWQTPAPPAATPAVKPTTRTSSLAPSSTPSSAVGHHRAHYGSATHDHAHSSGRSFRARREHIAAGLRSGSASLQRLSDVPASAMPVHELDYKFAIDVPSYLTLTPVRRQVPSSDVS